MAMPRFWPAVQVLGRTIANNRSDILQQSVRVYHQNTPVPHNINGHLFHHPNYEEKLRLQQNLLHTGRGSYLKVVSKSFSTGMQFFCREFTDGENEHAHDILCSLPAYKATTVNIKSITINYPNTFSLLTYKDKYWPSIGTEELINTFLYVSKVLFLHNETIEDQKYFNLISSLIERLPFMDDIQLMTVLSALSYWPQIYCNHSSNYDKLWKALDSICSRRLSRWDISKMFLVADHWYALRISKLSVYITSLINTLGINVMNLTPTQFVQFMFYVNLNREFGYIKQTNLIKKIEESLKSLTIEELGIIAMALFKTQTYISNMSIIEFIMKITIKNIDTISDHSLGSILKLLNKSLPGNAQTHCYNFLESLNPHLHKFNNFVLLQVSLFGNNLLVFHENALCTVGARFGNEISKLRLKDIERFTYALMLYKFTPPECPNILSLIVEELRKPERLVEMNHFPRCFSSCVNYLVAMGIFPHDLISAALQPSMVQLLKTNSGNYYGDIGRELNELNWSIKIEIPQPYLGYTLDSRQSQQLTKRFIGRIPVHSVKGLTHQEKLLLDVQSKISALMGQSKIVEPAIILPHFSNPDLIFCTTLEGDPVELPEEFKNFSFEDLKPAFKLQHLNLMWNAVMIGGRNSFIRETKHLKGNLEMKKRQLIMLGYKVSVVPYVGYVKTSTKYKIAFLEKCLMDSTLKLEGRKEMALNILKTVVEEQDHAIKLQEESFSHG